MTTLATFMDRAIADTISQVLKVATKTTANERLPKERLLQCYVLGSLMSNLKNNIVIVEKSYLPASGQRDSKPSCDLWFDLPCGDEVWVEVKSIWRSEDTVGKPLEMIRRYEKDLNKLRKITKSVEYKNAVKLFVLFSYTAFDPDESIESNKSSHNSFRSTLNILNRVLGKPIAQKKDHRDGFWPHAKVNYIGGWAWELPNKRKKFDLVSLYQD